jgi:GT2 family glycosyltransferase
MNAESRDASVSSRPSVAVVVLNWNGLDDTLACLESLRASGEPVHAIVVDNGSVGFDAQEIRASGLADLVLETGRNLGYAGGNNVGLRHALCSELRFEFIAVLNNDTIVAPDCFGALVHHLREHDKAPLALAPTILFFDDPSTTWFAGGVIDEGWPRHVQPDAIRSRRNALEPSEWLTGCCIVARATTWRDVGLFDPRYYLIFEDCDWSLRARARGVALVVATRATIRHKVSRSLGSAPMSHLGSYYFVRNGLRFVSAYSPRHLPHFVLRQLLRPTLSDVVRLKLRPGLGFRWLGAQGALGRRDGAAPRLVQSLAETRRKRAQREAARLARSTS